jgi:hypothetical protein
MTTTRLFGIQTILTICLVISFNSSYLNLDRNIHDQYFIDNFNIASAIFVMYSLFFSITYFSLRRLTNTILGLLHFCLGLPLFVLTFLEQLGIYNHDPQPRRYFTIDNSKIHDIFPIYISQIYQLTFAFLVIGLIVFVINLTLKRT